MQWVPVTYLFQRGFGVSEQYYFLLADALDRRAQIGFALLDWNHSLKTDANPEPRQCFDAQLKQQNPDLILGADLVCLPDVYIFTH